MPRKMHSDTSYILKEAASRLDHPTRRAFLKKAMGLGALTALAGCDVVDGVTAEKVPVYDVRFQRPRSGLAFQSGAPRP